MRIDWDSTGKRVYEDGVDRGVLYPGLGKGVAWNGLVSVKEGFETERQAARYFDGEKYNRGRGRGSFTAELEAYTYPEAFELYDGVEEIGSGLLAASQARPSFGLSYRTMLGNDVLSTEYGYRIHLVYNALAEPVSRSYSTYSDRQETAPLSWSISTRSIMFDNRPVSAHLIIDSTSAHPELIRRIEDVLYGSDDFDARLPPLDELMVLFEEYGVLKIFDHGDGTWSAEGPDEAIRMLDDTTFEIEWPSAVYLTSDEYAIDTY